MQKWIIGFFRKNGRQGKRTIRARSRQEAIAKCRRINDTFGHFLLATK